MGTVYRATDLRTGGTVAVKVVRPSLMSDPNYVTRLRREATNAARIDSPRVVRIIDLNTEDNITYFVMEYVDGKTLAERLRSGPLTVRQALYVAREIAWALDAIHSSGVVHRDLKPQNIKLVDGDVKVLDFGIARAEGTTALTAASVFVGTPDYVAPERMGAPVDPNAPAGDSTALVGDIRSDIYSLGIVLYELLTGETPFSRLTSPWAIVRAHETEPPPPLPDTVPFAMQAVVARCLAKRPDMRFQTPRELVAALVQVLGEPVTRSTPATGTSRVAGPPPTNAQTRSSDATEAGRVPPSPPAAQGAKIPSSTRMVLTLALVGIVAVALVVVLVVVVVGGGQGTAESGASIPPASTPAATTTVAAASGEPSTTLRVQRLVVFNADDTDTTGEGQETLRANAATRQILVCYSIPNASQALIKVRVLRGATEVGRRDEAVPPSGRSCLNILIEGGLREGQYTVRLLDAQDQFLREKRFTVQ